MVSITHQWIKFALLIVLLFLSCENNDLSGITTGQGGTIAGHIAPIDSSRPHTIHLYRYTHSGLIKENSVSLDTTHFEINDIKESTYLIQIFEDSSGFFAQDSIKIQEDQIVEISANLAKASSAKIHFLPEDSIQDLWTQNKDVGFILFDTSFYLVGPQDQLQDSAEYIVQHEDSSYFRGIIQKDPQDSLYLQTDSTSTVPVDSSSQEDLEAKKDRVLF